jgi:predicted GH43/DUF377 family glycosyl hydrolase
MTATAHLAETGVALDPDNSRVVTRFFVPGREIVGPGDSRAAPVIDRILQLDEAAVEATMHDIDARFLHRHFALHDTFREHADRVMSRIDTGVGLSAARRLLLGAAFTHEFAIEAAALCNPCAMLHPDQDAGPDAAFILSVRGIGEGHRSTIGFRTGVVSAAGQVTIARPGPFPRTAVATPGLNDKATFQARLAELGDDQENVAYVLDPLPARFEDAALDARIAELMADNATRSHTATTIGNLRGLARSAYRTTFPVSSEISERVLWPEAPVEQQGMEDARFVRFVDDNGTVTYYATYTAFAGTRVSQQLLETTDFANFTASPMAGAAASGKGLAIFPRRIGGKYVALSRSDRETNSIAFSDDLRFWDSADVIQTPTEPWEILQLGNCGSPIETDAGWLVLTHGVGPMRTYSLGAILLDLEAPERVIARARTPMVSPGNDRRDGYVPNVVYSCGAFAHGDTLVLPYGIGDEAISIATLSIADLLRSMSAEGS